MSVWLTQRILYSDVCLEAEVSPRGSKSAASASPRRSDASPRSCLGLLVMPRPCLGLDVMASASPWSRLFCLVPTRGIGASKLRYDIIICNFHPFILFISVFQKTKLHLWIKDPLSGCRLCAKIHWLVQLYCWVKSFAWLNYASSCRPQPLLQSAAFLLFCPSALRRLKTYSPRHKS